MVGLVPVWNGMRLGFQVKALALLVVVLGGCMEPISMGMWVMMGGEMVAVLGVPVERVLILVLVEVKVCIGMRVWVGVRVRDGAVVRRLLPIPTPG
jgi:hypothetical protein